MRLGQPYPFAPSSCQAMHQTALTGDAITQENGDIHSTARDLLRRPTNKERLVS